MKKDSEKAVTGILCMVAVILVMAIFILLCIEPANMAAIDRYRSTDNKMSIENTVDYPLYMQQVTVIAED